MKEFANDMNDDLLIKYLVGETTNEENVLVKQWIDASEANKKYFEQPLESQFRGYELLPYSCWLLPVH